MRKIQPIPLQVVNTQQLTPNLQRIALSGSQLSAFPDDSEGGYIKLLFTPEGSTDLSTIKNDILPIKRTYTIRHFSKDKCTLDIDFVRHSSIDLTCGFAARWAMNTQVGDVINISHPNNTIDMNNNADWFFMAADMTALPALAAKIAQLPKHAKGYAVIKIIEDKDKQTLNIPVGINVFWLTGNECLISQVKKLAWLNDNVFVWAACEFDDMRALRQYFRNEKRINKDNIYISSYWKQGTTEEGHKIIKRKDAVTSLVT